MPTVWIYRDQQVAFVFTIATVWGSNIFCSMDTKDPFKDLSFDGKPSGYREFRRKVILSVAALEYKSQHLAGPKLLTRLTGEAWRCTEHLNIAEVRTTKGWIKVIECLDRHYRYLPEVELHEAIDEFLFRLSRRQSEGATAFSSRFRTQLSRLETLIAQERVIAKEKRSKKKRDRSFFSWSTITCAKFLR